MKHQFCQFKPILAFPLFWFVLIIVVLLYFQGVFNFYHQTVITPLFPSSEGENPEFPGHMKTVEE